MLKSYKDVAAVILGVVVFCTVFLIAEKSGIRSVFNGSEALLSKGIGSPLLSGDSFCDFGRVFMHDGEKRHVFELKNERGGELRIKKVYTTCQCLEVYLRGASLEKGPYSLRDYLYQRNEVIVIGKGEKITAELVYNSSLQGPFGVGLSEPFAVIEDELGSKINLRISALVFP